MNYDATAGLVHSPRSVFERAIPLVGRVGAEPPTSARTMASASHERQGVSLEVAMVFHPALSSRPGASGTAGNDTSKPEVVGTRKPTTASAKSASVDTSRPPFHTDLRRIPSEAGELVVHCLRARNLRLPRSGSLEAKDVHPEVFLTAVPDGGEAATSTPSVEPGGRHPVWAQVKKRVPVRRRVSVVGARVDQALLQAFFRAHTSWSLFDVNPTQSHVFPVSRTRSCGRISS